MFSYTTDFLGSSRLLKQHKHTARIITDADLTPLINVVFLLLIFFLLAGTVATHSPLRPVLPESSARYSPYHPDIDIVIDTDGNIALRDNILTDHNALSQGLAILKKNLPAESYINIRADSSLPATKTLEVMQAAKAAGFNDIHLVAQVK